MVGKADPWTRCSSHRRCNFFVSSRRRHASCGRDWSSDVCSSDLVSKAGGLGVLGAVAHTPEQLEIDLAWIEGEVGDKPYGVDLIVPARYAGDEQGGYTLDDIRSEEGRVGNEGRSRLSLYD